ncbi:hypothetical protein P7C70_g745, partial [Phenoliferia sp. Uapishka_3]
MTFNLIYHAGIPGRAEDPTPFAPPVLDHDGLVISQTPNILLYLGARLPKIDLSAAPGAEKGGGNVVAKPMQPDAHTYHVNELALTVLDLVNEVHDTHHPLDITAYYEEQKDAALVRARVFRELRLPKFFAHFESNIKKAGGEFLTNGGPTYADLALFQVYDGLLFAFPCLMAQVTPQYPLISRLYERIKESPRVVAYLKSDRRQPYSMGLFRFYPELDAQ